MSELTIRQMSEINRTRCNRWHPGYPHDNNWNGADWSNAMCGEAGEAANVVKKLRRLETGAAPGPDDPSEAELRQMLADEIGDVFAYLDLLAGYYGIDLYDAIANKFNRVSERQGFPDRMPVAGRCRSLAELHPDRCCSALDDCERYTRDGYRKKVDTPCSDCGGSGRLPVPGNVLQHTLCTNPA